MLRIFATFLLVFAAAFQLTPHALAYSPEDPEVRAMVDRAVTYLGGLSEAELKSTPYGGGDGQVVLAALAHLKAEGNPDAPLVQLGLKHALQFVAAIKGNRGRLEHQPKSHYEIPVSIMFLTEMDSGRYRDELELLGKAMLALQMGHGGFGYPTDEHGDVSQVQYVVLALWTLDRANIEMPLEQIAKTLAWLARVQDVSGAWPYHGHDPGPGRGLIKQPTHEMSISTSLAGGSSVLIAADIFRLWGLNSIVGNQIEGLPKALKPVEREDAIAARKKKSPLTPEAVLSAARKMDTFRDRNPYRRPSSADWYYYMMYTLERYQSFFDLAMGKSLSNDWYDRGVKELMAVQDSSGAWGLKDASKNGAPVSTSFAVLFLIRSTKKSIGTISTGSLAGGQGLPSDTTKITLQGTQIKGEPVAAAVTDLLDLLEGDDASRLDGQSIPDNLQLETDPKLRTAQIARLERVVRGSQSWQARRVAARLLGTSDQLNVVPSLIHALSDPDKPTRTYARDGLAFISRRFEGAPVADTVEPKMVRASQQEWVRWYSSLFPNYVFLDGLPN